MTMTSLAGTALIVIGLALFGCERHDGHAAHEHSTTSKSPHPSGLDKSKKWNMDAHTRAVFAKMAHRLEGKDLSALSSTERKRTGAALRQDIDELVAGCTMTGDAHDALHEYLTAYIPAAEALAKSGGAAEAKKVYQLLKQYPDFFQ